MNLAAFGFEALNAAGLKNSVNRARVMKVNLSTNIIPQTLVELGYEFETDLSEGLKRWKDDEPAGLFL